MLDWLTNLFSGAGSGLTQAASSVAPVIESFGDVGGAAGDVAPSAPTWTGIADAARSVGSGAKDLWTGLGSVARTAAPIAQLGLAGMNIASNLQAGKQLAEQTKLARQSGQQQQAIANEARSTAAPIQKFSAEQLALAASGKLPDYMENEVERWVSGEKQKLRDYFARAGIGDSTSINTALQEVDKRALSIRGQLIQGMQAGGVSAAGTAGSILGGAAQAAHGAGITGQNQQASMQELIARAASEMAKLSGQAA